MTAQLARSSRAAYERSLTDESIHSLRLARTQAWRDKNAEHLSEYGKRYRSENAQRITEKNRRRRARLLSAWDEDVDLQALLVDAGGLCGICGESIDSALSWPNTHSLTLDHIVPLAKGGRHAKANCQPAHAVCNSRKNDRIA